MDEQFGLGKFAEYVDTKGHAKLALIIAVPGQIKSGSTLTPLEEGFVNVDVFSPSGSVYARQGVPLESKAKELDQYQNADGTLHNYVRAISDFTAAAAAAAESKEPDILGPDEDDVL
jgi:hypothetical protein